MILKKKILFLLTRMPYPAKDGTRAKILYNVLDAVKDRYECTVVIVSDEKPDAGSVAYLEEHYGKIRYFYTPQWRRALSGLLHWFCGYPLQTSYFFSRRVARAIASDMASADVIYAHTIRVGGYFNGASESVRQKTMFDFNDAISYNYATAKQYASFWWRLIYSLELPRVARYEMKMLSCFRHCTIVSEADKDYMVGVAQQRGIAMGDGAFRVIRHGVNDKLLNYKNDYRGNRDMVFLGNIFYPPNRDSVVWFSNFLEEQPSLALGEMSYDVIGRYSQNLKKICPRAIFSGFVEDPYRFIMEHKIFVSPLRFGSGVPTKILEAMAIGMPVITTPEGARSVEGAHNGENIIICPAIDTKGWAVALELLVNDHDLRKKIGRNAQVLVREKYRSSLSCAAYGKYFDDIAGG